MEKTPRKMQRKLIFIFTQKKTPKILVLGCLKRPYFENCLSLRAEILHEIQKKIVLGLDGKNSFKNAQ
jgi:hypothetical protein